MPDVVSVKVDASRVNLKLDAMPEDVRAALADEIYLLGGELVDRARERAETLLAVKTGKFLSRIRLGFNRRRNSFSGRVYSSAKTANIFEWGGKTGAHDILPDKARALRIGDKFAARAHHPGGTYKRLEIIHGAFAAMKPQIQAGLQGAVEGAAVKANA